MTVLWAGGEDISFTVTGSTVITTGGSDFRAAFSRCGFNTGAASGTWPIPNSIVGPVLSGITSGWYHGRYSNINAGSNATSSNVIMMGLADSGGVGRILVRGTGTAGQVKISTRNAAGTIVDLVTSASGAVPLATSGQPFAVDLFVNYSVTGQATLYINGGLIADTGAGVDVTTNGVTQLAQLSLGGLLTSSGEAWSEVIIADSDTRGMALQTLPPVAAGATQSWTPNTVGNINPVTANDANFVSTPSVNALSEWTVSTSLPAGSWNINAVVQAARVNAGASGPQHYEWLVRTSDGSDHVQGSVAPPIGAFGNSFSVWLTNPHTSAPWGTGELVNAGIESLT